MMRPRVLVVSHMYPRDTYPMGGIFVHEQVKALRDRGLEVSVLTGDPAWIAMRGPRRFYWSVRALWRRPLGWRWRDGVPAMSFPYLVGGIFRNFIHGPTYAWGLARAAAVAGTRFPFDIIHAHTSFLDGHAAVRLGRRFGVPVVITEHMGPFSVLTRHAGFRFFTRHAVRNADRVFAVSRALRRDMIAALGADAERVEVLGNGFDDRLLVPAARRPDGEAGSRMLWVGHVSPVKGVDQLLAAMASVSGDVPDLRLTIMGGGENLDAVRAQAVSLGLSGRVDFLPAGARAEVAAAIVAHDFLVVSSHKETFSLAALEALACGRPVLTTACGGPEDFVTDGGNGLVVPDSEAGLADGLRRMSRLHAGFAPQALAESVRSRSWAAVAAELETVYRGLVRTPQAEAPPAREARPRRILMITTDHLMIDRRILQEAESLRDAGHHVEILAGFECARAESFLWRGIRISRFVFDWSDPRAAALLRVVPIRGGRAWRYLWKATCKAVAIATGINSFEHFVLREVMQRDFDVLHVHDFPLLRVGAEIKRRRASTLVYDAHELYHAQAQLPPSVQRRYRRREKRLIRRADAAFTVNPYIAAIMARDYGCTPPGVILNAAPLEPATVVAAAGLRTRLGLPADARIVLYQGWMSPERGIDTLVRAAALFPAGIHLVLVGYGDCEAELKAISREQGTDDGRVVFLGRMEPDELAAITPEADLGVIPYRPVDLNHLYCSPNKLFEFAVAGVPFVANDLPFLREVSDRYGFGLIADMADPARLAEAVASAVADPQRLSGLKAAARKAATELNWRVESQKLLDIYAALPSGPAHQQAAQPDPSALVTGGAR